MTYSEFEVGLLPALVTAADASGRGQCEALQIAEAAFPGVKPQWIRDAVDRYESRGYLGAVSRPLDGRIILTVTGAARRASESSGIA